MEKDTRYQPLDKASISADQISRPSVSYWKDAWRRFRKDKLAMFGLVMIIIVSLFAIFGPMFCPYEYDEADFLSIAQWPSKVHWFGTDALGRDLYVRVLYGARISLSIGVVAALVNMVIGVLYGGIAGYFGGKVDNILMRLMDILMAIPGMLLAISLAAVLKPGLMNLVIAIAIADVPGYARVVRASVLTIKDQEYIEAATCIGASDRRIILRHIIPNCMAPIIVQATLGVAGAILSAASLSFLGLGIQPPTPEWGSMLSSARQFIRQYWHMTTFPGLAIMITIFALNVLGDGLRDALDPRMKN